MNITCKKSALLEGISNVQKAVPLRCTLPILSGILVQADHNLVLTGYDMQMGIRYTLGARIQQPGCFVINSKLFGDIVRRASEEDIHLTCDESFNIQITSGQSVFNVKGQPAEAFPVIEETTRINEMTMGQSDLKTLIRRTIFSVSHDETRVNLNGCYFKSTPNRLEMVGIDGFRVSLARLEAPEGVQWPELEFIIPTKSLRDVMSLLEEQGEVSLIHNQNQLIFDFGRTRLTSRLIAEAYMRYESVLPKQCQSELIVERKPLLDSIDRATLMNTLDVNRLPVTLKTEDDQLQLYTTTQRGNFHETLPIELKGDEVDVDFNPYYLIEALKVIDDDRIVFGFNGSSGPGVIRPLLPEDAVQHTEPYLFIILPLRK